MKRIRTLYILFFILTFNACHHDDDNLILDCNPMASSPCERLINLTPTQDTCIELNWGNGIEIIQTGSDTSYKTPMYIKGSTDVFAFTRIINDVETHLWKMDMCKMENSLLFENFIYHDSDLREGANDWITFDIVTRKIFISKINGDSLMELLPEMNCRYPVWLDSESIYCNCKLEPPIYNRNFIYSLLNNNLDTLDYSTANFELYENKIAGYTAFFGEFTIGYTDLSSNSYQEVIPWSLQNLPVDMGWLDEDHIIWIDKMGIHKVNINTSEIINLKEVCENVLYRKMSVVPGKNEILLSRTDRWNIGQDTLHSETHISIFNTENGEEQFVELE